MILITGAGGKTGKTVLKALSSCGAAVRALVHRQEQVDEAMGAGAVEALNGDILSPGLLTAAFEGVEKVYHICPNMHPQEFEITRQVLAQARKTQVKQFVYHSVLHPQIEAMPHHWQKMRVEEMLFTAGLAFTILQPCAYMQNVMGYWDAITRQGVYEIPYATSTRISVVDLEDVAETAARVLTEAGHGGATYELSGPQPLTQDEVASQLANALGRTVAARALDRTAWEQNARATGMPEYTVETLASMFEYYEQNGFTGSPRVMEYLLGRPARTFSEFITRQIPGGSKNG